MYLVAYGKVETKAGYTLNLIIDDRDVLHMKKEELQERIYGVIEQTLKKPESINVKVILVSDTNESNLWEFFGDSAVIFNTKATSSFVNLNVPQDFLEIYENLPTKFKLSDFERESFVKTQKKYHRNTYQNWLKILKNAGFLKLKKKTYEKIEGKYKTRLLDELKN
jgi:hypothetical protein